MAAGAGIGGAGVVALVACVAVVFDGCVCSGKGIKLVVVERRWRPSLWVVAGSAIGRKFCA